MKAHRWALAILGVITVGVGGVAAAPAAHAQGTGGVSFTATDFRGDPAVATDIWGGADPYHGPNAFELSTDTAGHASSTDVPPGTYSVGVQPLRATTDSLGPYYAFTTVTVVAGQTTDVTIHLPASDWVSGRVTDRLTHKGVGGVEVDAYSQCRYAGDLCDSHFEYTDAAGYYTIHSLGADPSWGPITYTVALRPRAADYGYRGLMPTTYTIQAQPGLGHEGLDFQRYSLKSSLPTQAS